MYIGKWTGKKVCQMAKSTKGRRYKEKVVILLKKGEIIS